MSREYRCWSCGQAHQGAAPTYCQECGRPPLEAPECLCGPYWPRGVSPTAEAAYCGGCGGWLKRPMPGRAKSRAARKRRIYRQLGLLPENGNKTAGQRGSESAA